MNSIFQRYVLSTSKVGLGFGVTQYNTRYANLFDIQILMSKSCKIGTSKARKENEGKDE